MFAAPEFLGVSLNESIRQLPDLLVGAQFSQIRKSMGYRTTRRQYLCESRSGEVE